MPRVKRGPQRKNRRVKILKAAKGYWGMKSRGHRIAKQQVERGLNFAFAGRKDRKGQFRKLWIARINAAARIHGISYSKLVGGLKPRPYSSREILEALERVAEAIQETTGEVRAYAKNHPEFAATGQRMIAPRDHHLGVLVGNAQTGL